MKTQLPANVEAALTRSEVYAALSRGFLYPSRAWAESMRGLPAALKTLPGGESLTIPENLETQHQAWFGGQVPACPPYETEYTAAHLWMQTQQMADIAGFYRAFGVDATETGERVDALATELEFMYMLSVKEAIAEHEHNSEGAEVTREAQGKFLKEHLAVWLPRFAAKLAKQGATGFYPALVGVAQAFVATEAERFDGEGSACSES